MRLNRLSMFLMMAADEAQSTSITQSAPPGALMIPDFGEDDEGRGFENLDSSSKDIPRLKLLQGLSPEVQGELPGAKPGCWMNTVTGKIYDRDKGLGFLISSTRHCYGRWVPRKAGGGFRGHVEIGDPDLERAMARAKAEKAKFGKYSDDDGNELVETHYTFGVELDENGDYQGASYIAFKSTMIRPYRTYMTRVDSVFIPGKVDPETGRKGRTRKPPLWSFMTRLGAVKDKNDQGEFWVPVVKSWNPAGPMASMIGQDDDRYQMAKGLLLSMEAGAAKVDYSKEQDSDGSTGDNVM